MKKILFFLFVGLLAVSCEKDDNVSPGAELHLDGPNQSAPFFEPGTYEAAARFTANYTRQYEGKTLEAVEFYLLELPIQCEIKIYDIGTVDTPGNLLYSADVTSGISPNIWNRHVLTNPVEITGDDLWISVKVRNSSRSNIIGCDSGPANSNGDWTLSSADNDWKTYRERTNQLVNINWNIRGDVSE